MFSSCLHVKNIFLPLPLSKALAISLVGVMGAFTVNYNAFITLYDYTQEHT